jgi:hypothetical protein
MVVVKESRDVVNEAQGNRVSPVAGPWAEQQAGVRVIIRIFRSTKNKSLLKKFSFRNRKFDCCRKANYNQVSKFVAGSESVPGRAARACLSVSDSHGPVDGPEPSGHRRRARVTGMARDQ